MICAANAHGTHGSWENVSKGIYTCSEGESMPICMSCASCSQSRSDNLSKQKELRICMIRIIGSSTTRTMLKNDVLFGTENVMIMQLDKSIILSPVS